MARHGMGMSVSHRLMAALLIAFQAADFLCTRAAAQPDAAGGSFTGYGTYSSGGDGLCQPSGQVSSSSASGLYPVAINAAQGAGGSACGSCVQVSSSGAGAGKDPYPPSFTGLISSICSTCDYGGLDLASGKDGRWEITWQFVPCPGGGSGYGAGRKLMTSW